MGFVVSVRTTHPAPRKVAADILANLMAGVNTLTANLDRLVGMNTARGRWLREMRGVKPNLPKLLPPARHQGSAAKTFARSKSSIALDTQ